MSRPRLFPLRPDTRPNTKVPDQTDASLQELVDGGFLGESTRTRVVYRTLIHTWSEYGVMTVYLRLNDIVPPASR